MMMSGTSIIKSGTLKNRANNGIMTLIPTNLYLLDNKISTRGGKTSVAVKMRRIEALCN